MAHSKGREFGPRCRNGVLWKFIKAQPGEALRDRFVFADHCTTVEVMPPSDPIRDWLVIVDGIEILELYGHTAEARAFAAADAFALQTNSLTEVLREQGYVKLPRKYRKGRRR